MKRRSKKVTAAVIVAAIAAAAIPAVVVASIITNATGVAVKVSPKLKPTTNAVFMATTGPVAGATVTCTASTTSLTLSTKGGGLGPFTITNPTFTGCTDNLPPGSNPDTVTTNNTNGPWTATYVNSTGSPNPDQIQLGVPKAGMTLVSSAAAGCTLTLDAAGPGTLSGAYDNAGNLQFTNQAGTYTTSGTCPSSGTGNVSFSTALKSGATGKPVYMVSPIVFGIH